MKSRIVSLDAARAICMFWIVGIWHLQEYFKYNPNRMNTPYTTCITVGVLSVFTFISGFFMSENICNKSDVAQFYKRRFLRFYPLFLLSCCTLFLLSHYHEYFFINSIRQLIFTLTGISCFVAPPSPATVWYFSMLIVFYAITPLINIQKKTVYKILICIMLYIPVYIGVSYKLTDARILIFFPIYFMALICAPKIKPYITGNWNYPSAIISLVIAVFSVLLCVELKFSNISKLVVALTFIPLLYYLGILATKIFTSSFISVISYASMCAYLFHRQFYSFIRELNGGGGFSVWTAYLILLPILLLISYCIQKIYDMIVDIINKTPARKP